MGFFYTMPLESFFLFAKALFIIISLACIIICQIIYFSQKTCLPMNYTV